MDTVVWVADAEAGGRPLLTRCARPTPTPNSSPLASLSTSTGSRSVTLLLRQRHKLLTLPVAILPGDLPRRDGEERVGVMQVQARLAQCARLLQDRRRAQEHCGEIPRPVQPPDHSLRVCLPRKPSQSGRRPTADSSRRCFPRAIMPASLRRRRRRARL